MNQKERSKRTLHYEVYNKFDNYFENLRWATASENNYYAYETSASKSGKDSYQAKLSNLRQLSTMEELKMGNRAYELMTID